MTPSLAPFAPTGAVDCLDCGGTGLSLTDGFTCEADDCVDGRIPVRPFPIAGAR